MIRAVDKAEKKRKRKQVEQQQKLETLTPAGIDEIRRELKKLYEAYEPSKANKVKNLMKKYAGQEIWLYNEVKQKFKSLKKVKREDMKVEEDRTVKGEEVEL